MDSIILAGGFAQRMAPTTNEAPKHLLPVAGKPMLSYVLDSLEKFYSQGEGGTCYISINKKFEKDFKNFIKDYNCKMPLKLIVEDTLSEGQKLGSVGALHEIFKKGVISTNPGVLVIGGDNIFSMKIRDFVKAFNLQGDYYKEKGIGEPPSLFAVYDLKSLKKARLYGTVGLTSSLNNSLVSKISFFKEKDDNPKSTMVSTAIYLFSNSEINKIGEYLSKSNGDAMGNFLEWILCNPKIVHADKTSNLQSPRIFAIPFKGYWFDIGDHKSFEEANCFFRSKKNKDD